MPLQDDKKEYLLYELGILTVKAAFSTRVESSPIYLRPCTPAQRNAFQDAIRSELAGIEGTYSNGRVAEDVHCGYIEFLSHRITGAHSTCLHDGEFRFGIAQKLVNLYLKYLWVAGMIEEPPHCPIDGIVRDLAGLTYDWTMSNSRQEYERTIASLKLHAEPRSLAVWELQEFRRRAQ
jgi:hypothetical protein